MPNTKFTATHLHSHPRHVSRTRGICTLPHRLFTIRGLRRRRTALSEWTPHFGHAGLRGPAVLAKLVNQVARSRRPTFSTCSSRASKVGRRLIVCPRAQGI